MPDLPRHERRISEPSATEQRDVAASSTWLEKVQSITTARGSVYTVLPDGRTQRYKTKGAEFVDGAKEKHPYELMVFLPDWETIKRAAPPDVLEKLGDTKEIFMADLATKFRGDVKGYKGYVTDETGKKLRVNKEVIDAKGQVWVIILKEDKTYVHIPVHKEPKEGRSTVEMNRIDQDDGSHITERHVGNEIVEITYKN